MLFAELCYQIFEESTSCYHQKDCVDAEMVNPYEYKSIEYYLFLKNWIDAIQWHLEDMIREQETQRGEVTQVHVKACEDKLSVLLEQKRDLIRAIDQLLDDIETGHKYMKVYKQMKMYNDPELNPVLYRKGQEL